MWKPSIDALDPLLGRTYPTRQWNPLDGRIVRLGLHRAVDPNYVRDVSMLVRARAADESWPELAWLASLDDGARAAFLAQHQAKLRLRAERSLLRIAQQPPTRPRHPNHDTGQTQVNMFDDDDPGYREWIAAHPGGYVLNIQRGLNPIDARMHLAGCRTINGEPARGSTWTGPYIKICATDLRKLDVWAATNTNTTIARCGVCRPPASQDKP